MVEWHLKGPSFANCNCDHACPCQFEGLPTHGNCEAFGVVDVEEGAFGDIDLAGTRFAIIYSWPGPVFEGGGEMQIIIDDRCSAAQRDALAQIGSGRETVEGSTHWWVFATMCDTHHEVLDKRIDLDVDMEKFTVRCSIDGVVESSAEPIRSRVDGSPHRVRIQVPHGIEFDTAEIINGKTTTKAAVKLELNDTYGQLYMMNFTHRGPAHNLQTV